MNILKTVSGRLVILLGLLFILGGCEMYTSQKININSNLIFGTVNVKQYERSPLAAIAEFATNEPVKVTVTIKGQDNNDITHVVGGYATNHEIPILGLYPDYVNIITLQLESINNYKETITIQVPTKKLPDGFPEITVIKNNISGPNDEVFVLPLAKVIGGINDDQIAIAVDRYGKVRWYYKGQFNLVLKRRKNKNFIIVKNNVFWNILRDIKDRTSSFLFPNKSAGEYILNVKSNAYGLFKWTWLSFERVCSSLIPESSIVEIDIWGRERMRWDSKTLIHHDVTELPNGNLLALTQDKDSFEDELVEIDSFTKKIINKWDYKEILDATREPQPKMIEKNDWLHLNTVIYDKRDSSIIVSARNQSAIIKLKKESKKIQWILSNHEKWGTSFRKYLLNPVGNNFEWLWGQHAPVLESSTENGILKLLVYDNGNDRGYNKTLPPQKSYSRAVEYEIDETAKTVKQIWQYGKERGSELFTPFAGSAINYNKDILICFGGISREIAGRPSIPWDINKGVRLSTKNLSRILEVSKKEKSKVLFEMEIKDSDSKSYVGYECYRSYKLSFY